MYPQALAGVGEKPTLYLVLQVSAGSMSQNHAMTTTKEKVVSLLSKLPDNCSLEDVQYHLYVLEKVRHGLEVADTQETITQQEAEVRLSKWLIK